MKLTKCDWLLIISCLVITLYSWAVMFTGVANNWPFGSGGGWFGSLSSVLVGALLLSFWLILAVVRAATLLYREYADLTPGEKSIVGRIMSRAAEELIKKLRRRQDRVGKIIRLGDRMRK